MIFIKIRFLIDFSSKKGRKTRKRAKKGGISAQKVEILVWSCERGVFPILATFVGILGLPLFFGQKVNRPTLGTKIKVITFRVL